MIGTTLKIIIIIILIIITGYLSMAELAVVSIRKAKMQKYLEEGDKRAQIVMDLLEDPNEFLSTVQIGISLIGVLSGAFGGVTLAEPLAKYISFIPYAEPVSVAVVVIVTTYLTLVVGEIVPKVIALNDPERISLKVAKSMVILSKISLPVSFILAKSSSFLLWLMRIENRNDDIVTEEEIELMIKEGREDGTIEQEEEDIIKRVFKLDDQKVESIMTPRNEIIWIDLEDDREVNKIKIIESKRSIFPISSGELDDFIGVVQAKDILSAMFTEDEFDVHKIVKEPLVVSEHLETLELLKEFKENQEYVHMSLVVDEFGSVEGLITLNDLLEGIVGDIPGIDEDDEPKATQRLDGSWLIDGRYPIEKFKELFELKENLPDEEEDGYTTLAGFILSLSGTIPDEEDRYDCGRFIFEIVDIDGHQIDKVLVIDLGPQEEIKEEE
ncbi:MAG: HlyC/CorC family transporter [Methanobrevibacter thaueri]|jgi:putative hemolysin|uniref:hemolysin family protein n=1 Tax=Methanobrevibacter thaueri TaxID=190975 RepID=UPI0026F1DD51|nr:hemolysin family protein [Methanobrevibacter thaueri]MBE6495996.1 HlyC/CorC family transporter [Methanobrevibacter thaueri]